MSVAADMDEQALLVLSEGAGYVDVEGVGPSLLQSSDDDGTATAGGDGVGGERNSADVTEIGQLKSEDQCEMYCNTMLDRIGLGRYAPPHDLTTSIHCENLCS
jgi:hypothetical protein